MEKRSGESNVRRAKERPYFIVVVVGVEMTSTVHTVRGTGQGFSSKPTVHIRVERLQTLSETLQTTFEL